MNSKQQNTISKKYSNHIKDWPINERPRERLLNSGVDSLSDAELIAIILRVGKMGQTAEDLGRCLLTEFEGLSGLDRALPEAMLKIKGLGIAKVAQLKAAIELGKRARVEYLKKISFDTSKMVFEYCKPKFEGKRHECFLVLLLDGQNKLLAERIITEGIPTTAHVYVRKIMEEALRFSASSIVVVHNHPSNEANPSEPDKLATKKIKQASEILDIVFLDHIIICAHSYYSFADENEI